MKIVIIGCGNVGGAICSRLLSEGHDITVVDTSEREVTELSGRCDVAGVVGNGADVSVLLRAGADRADLLIAVTSKDEINILCCAGAKKLGASETIARVRNPEYTGLTQLMQNELALSLTINPELAAAEEIYRTLRYPSAAKIHTCCRGRVELAEFAVPEDSPIIGSSLVELRGKLGLRFLVCGVIRDGQATVPAGSFRVSAGDVLCVTAPEREITPLFKAIGAYKTPVRAALIVGGGRTTYYLAKLLSDAKIRATVVEKDKAAARALAEEGFCAVVCDDGTKEDVLSAEGIRDTDAFLALTDEDEANAVISLYAKSQGVSKIVTMIRSMPYADLFRAAGLESIVSPRSSTASQIVQYARSMAKARDSEIRSLYRPMDGALEVLEFSVKEEVPGLTGTPLRSVHLKDGILIACIVHKGTVVIPNGDDAIECGDTVLVATSGGQTDSIADIVKS